MADVTLKIKSKQVPPIVVEIVVDDTEKFNETYRVMREGAFGVTAYGWRYIPAERVDSIEIYV
jgi:hypothetical protein